MSTQRHKETGEDYLADLKKENNQAYMSLAQFTARRTHFCASERRNEYYNSPSAKVGPKKQKTSTFQL